MEAEGADRPQALEAPGREMKRPPMWHKKAMAMQAGPEAPPGQARAALGSLIRPTSQAPGEMAEIGARRALPVVLPTPRAEPQLLGALPARQ